MNQEALKKLDEIQKLLKEKEEIECKLEKLLSPEKQIVIPSDFSINDEILFIVKEEGESGISILTIVKKMKDKFPNYGIDRKRIASAIAYLKNTKKEVEIVGRGVYRIKIKQNT